MSFDTLAPHYRWLETVVAGELLQRCRTRYLGELRHANHVLVIGPGRGRFVRSVLTTASSARLTLVDSSSGMLRRIARDLRSSGDGADRVRFVHADIRSWTPEEDGFDAIASHFVLDCFAPEELGSIVARVASWSTPRSLWLVSDFQIPRHGWKRWRARAIHALMYAAFRRVTSISARAVSPPDPFLERAGFSLAGRQELNHGLLHADLWRRAPLDRVVGTGSY